MRTNATASMEPPAIVVAGEALIDLLSRDDANFTAVPGGSPFNTARAIARLGLSCGWIGGLSEDRFGRLLESALAADGVDLRYVQLTNLPTTLALAELDESGAASYRFYIAGTAGPAVDPEPLAGGFDARTKACLVGSLGLVLEPMASTVEGLVSTLPDGVILVVDPNARPAMTLDLEAWRSRLERVIRRADVVKASVEDLALLHPGASPREAVEWIQSLGPAAVVVTDGPNPVVLAREAGVRTFEPESVAVVDTIGAGDTFAGALVAFLVNAGVARQQVAGAASVDAAVRFALRASAEVCRRVGADPPTLAELGGWSDVGG